MIARKILSDYLNKLLPSMGVVDYCPNGLQVEGKEIICKVATAVSSSLETIQAAVEAKVEALIVHHGLFWQKDSYVIQGSKKKKLALLLEHGISLFAYHLPLDLHPQLGNNWKAAMDMGWKDLQPFGYFEKTAIGVKGSVSEQSVEEFKVMLENYYGHSAICAFGGKERIKTAALISGGAYKSLIEAAQTGVDAFITGSFDEPTWYQAYEEKINFFGLGHAATERVGPIALQKHIEQDLKLPCLFIDTFNPF